MLTIRRARVLALLALALVTVSLAVACSAPGGSPEPVGNGPLLTVESRGGECLQGPCGTTITIERDGTVHEAAKPPNQLGVLPAAQLAALDAAIKTTDFPILKSHPFTGECPTAFDGQEFVFEFGAPGGVQRIATCEIAVDFGSPLFVAVSAALAPYMPLPTT